MALPIFSMMVYLIDMAVDHNHYYSDGWFSDNDHAACWI